MGHAGSIRRLGVLVLVGLSLAASGCGTTASPPAHAAQAFRPAPEVPPIERLGRWDGTTFVPVTAASVRTGDVYVLVHGWAPGYLGAVQRFRGPGPLLAWSPQAVDASGQRMFSSFFPLAAAITRDDPGATVLGFSWLDDAATTLSPLVAWRSEARTDLNGQRLAAALGQVLAPTFGAAGDRLHLIGHSHGAKVATVAALALDRPPDQLTLLDSPEDVLARIPGAANHLEGYLPLLPIGRGPGQTFVDSYFTITGERYSAFPGLEAVVDVQLDPAQFPGLGVDELIARHGYPVSWYTASADDLAAGVGLAWSPLIGTPPECLACFFRQDWRRPGGGVDPTDELRLEHVPVTLSRKTNARRLEVQPLRGPSTSLRPDGVMLVAPGQRLWQVEFDTNPTDLAIELDDRFTAPEAGAQLGIWLDDRQVFATAAAWSGATGHHAVIDVSTLSPGRHTMTAVLTPPAQGGTARVILGGFLVQSQPGASDPGRPLSAEAKLALLALALFAVIGVLAGVLRRGERAASAR
ncbi:MAG: hypothetical protein ACXVIM_04300 [Acidimicrobiia bacterium]